MRAKGECKVEAAGMSGAGSFWSLEGRHFADLREVNSTARQPSRVTYHPNPHPAVPRSASSSVSIASAPTKRWQQIPTRRFLQQVPRPVLVQAGARPARPPCDPVPLPGLLGEECIDAVGRRRRNRVEGVARAELLATGGGVLPGERRGEDCDCRCLREGW